MLEKEIDKTIRAMKSFGRKIKKDPNLAREFLLRTGIYTPKGRLKKVYREDE